MNRFICHVVVLGLSVPFLAHAQFDATKSAKTVQSIAPKPKPATVTVDAADLSFAGFLKAYAGLSRTTDVYMQHPFIDKKGYNYFANGTVRFIVDVTQSNICVTENILAYGVVRKGCVDSFGNAYTAFRGYGLYVGNKTNESLLADVPPTTNMDKEIDKAFALNKGDQNPYLEISGKYSYERFSADFNGLSVFLPSVFSKPIVSGVAAKFIMNNTGVVFSYSEGTCLRFDRNAFAKGLAVIAGKCGGL